LERQWLRIRDHGTFGHAHAVARQEINTVAKHGRTGDPHWAQGTSPAVITPWPTMPQVVNFGYRHRCGLAHRGAIDGGGRSPPSTLLQPIPPVWGIFHPAEALYEPKAPARSRVRLDTQPAPELWHGHGATAWQWTRQPQPAARCRRAYAGMEGANGGLPAHQPATDHGAGSHVPPRRQARRRGSHHVGAG